MSKTETIFLKANDRLTITADASSSGHYYRINSGADPSGFTAVAASTAPTIGPFSEPRCYAVVSELGTLTTAAVPYTAENVGITADETATLTNKTYDANGTGNALSNVDVADLAVGTDGQLITWDASGDPATVAVGTATEVLTSNGVGAAPTFQAAGGGGAWSLISSSVNFAGVATVDFTDLTSAFSQYMVVFVGVRGVTTDQTLQMLGSVNNGSSYSTSADYEYAMDFIDTGATAGVTTSTSANFIQLSANGIDNSAANGLAGTLLIYEPMNGASRGYMTGKFMHTEDATTDSINTCGTYKYDVASMNAIRFKAATGNLSGEGIYLYGLSRT